MNGWETLFGTRRREYTALLLLFLLIAVAFTWPLILHMHDGMLGGRHDPLLNTWILSWDAKAIFTHPSGLFQANILYPSRDVLAYSEHMLALGVMAAPIIYATSNPVLAYNLLILLGLVFTAFGGYLLVKELTGSRWGGLAGGLFFAFCPYKIGTLAHLQILFCPFLPLMLLYLHRYLERGGRREVVLFGLFFLLQSLVSWHYLVFCSLSGGLLWLWSALSARRAREWSRLGWAALAILVVAVLVLPLALPYLEANSRLPAFSRTLEEVESRSVDIQDYARVLPENLLYGSPSTPFPKASLAGENALYPGIIILLLAIFALLPFRKKGREEEAPSRLSDTRRFFYLLLLSLGVFLTFGPRIGGINEPLYTLPFHLGMFKFIRYPSRFFVLAVLGLSVLGGYGTARIVEVLSRWRKTAGLWRAGAALLVLLLVLEMAAFGFTVYPVPTWGNVPEVYNWLGEQEGARIIELPTLPLKGTRFHDWYIDVIPEDLMSYLQREGYVMYLSTCHWRDMANGYSGYTPFFYRRIFAEMQAFPSARTVELLRSLDIDYVVWHWEWVEEGRRAEYKERLLAAPGLSLQADFGEQAVYRVEDGTVATAEDLAVHLQSPSSAPRDSFVNLGLLVRNPTGDPFASAEEDQHTFIVTFKDMKGNEVLTARGSYRIPFFLQGGEESSVPLRIERVPDSGAYGMDLELTGGALAGRSFHKDIEISSPEELSGTGLIEGSLSVKDGEDPINIPVPGGLYPVVLEASNSGDAFLRASWEDAAEEPFPYGLVFSCIQWEREDGTIDAGYTGVLPCDVAPGQVVEVPLLVPVPEDPGIYYLVIGLVDRDVGGFGKTAGVEVTVE